MRCAVCGIKSEAVTEQRTVSGTRYGMACPGECQGLLWEAHFVKATGGDAHELDLVMWGWRKRRAHIEGAPFTTPPPESPAEKEFNRLLTDRGLMGVARELE